MSKKVWWYQRGNQKLWTFQQHLHMEYISFSWYDIPVLLLPITIDYALLIIRNMLNQGFLVVKLKSVLPKNTCSSTVFRGKMIHIAQSLVFCVVFCRSLFDLLSRFVWSLYCLSFFDILFLYLKTFIQPLFKNMLKICFPIRIKR